MPIHHVPARPTTRSGTSLSPRRTRPGARLGALGAVVALVAALVPFAAAHASPSTDADGATPPGSGWIRTGQFVAGLAPVEIQLTTQSGSTVQLGQRVAYGDVSAYRQVAPGRYTVGVRPESAASSSAPMLRRTMVVTSGKASTVALLGTKSAPRLATLLDDLTSPAAGSSRVRVLSGSSAASGLTINAVNGPHIASDVVLGQVTPYATVPDGDWTLRLDRKGKQPLRQPINLDSGAVYTAVVLDGTGKTDIKLALVTDAQGAAMQPKGGAATGGGGTAVRATGAPQGWLLALGTVGAALVIVGAVRTGVTPRRRTARR